jgi:hypothetical protein
MCFGLEGADPLGLRGCAQRPGAGMSNWEALCGFTSSNGEVDHGKGAEMTAVLTIAEVDSPVAVRLSLVTFDKCFQR